MITTTDAANTLRMTPATFKRWANKLGLTAHYAKNGGRGAPHRVFTDKDIEAVQMAIAARKPPQLSDQLAEITAALTRIERKLNAWGSPVEPQQLNVPFEESSAYVTASTWTPTLR
jgi:hypothetical protein